MRSSIDETMSIVWVMVVAVIKKKCWNRNVENEREQLVS